jgi:hypothetical protein
MYLTAQRVFSPATKREGINAFYYVHGNAAWLEPPLPESDPGTLHRKLISIDPPGNRVRSYLDIVAPDNASLTDLRHALMTFVSTNQRRTLPWKSVSGSTLLRFGADEALAQQWSREIADLFRAIEAVRLHA